MNLTEQLQDAINRKDTKAIKEIQKKILLLGRDESIDEEFVRSIDGKTLYKNLKRSIKEDNSLDKLDYMKLVSSLLTHNIIEAQVKNKSLEDYPINELYIILGSFLNSEEEVAIHETKEFIQDRYSKFL